MEQRLIENPKHAVMRLFGRAPFIFLGGNGSKKQVLVTDFEEVSFAQVASCRFYEIFTSVQNEQVFEGGFVGLASYDDFSNVTTNYKSRLFKIKGALVFEDGLVKIHGELAGAAIKILSEKYPQEIKSSQAIKLTPYKSDDDYISQFNLVKKDILNGRYYQANILRYFRAKAPSNEQEIVDRFFKLSGYQGSIFSLHNEKVISFSPERFIKISPQIGEPNLRLETWPIKGTRPRGRDNDEDERLARELVQSKKDNAELHMIVDLMRNDFRRVSIPKSIKVLDKGSLQSFSSVHHLVAKISADMSSDTRISDFFHKLFPAGSITGAPKIEVMKAISEYEGRPRNWFMGNAFYLLPSGHFDSSVLIRTLWQKPDQTYEYAAGSGLVVKSEANDELEEIKTKCRVVTQAI